MGRAIPTIDYSRCKPNILDRFWAKVDRSGDCWEWTASRVGEYGIFGVYAGKTMTAHRFIDIALNGDMNQDEYTLHKCDNPLCVRPSHLFRGTQKVNMRDMISKGRRVIPPSAFKITKEQSEVIRTRHNSGESLASIASDFGISKSQVSRIGRRQCWDPERVL